MDLYCCISLLLFLLGLVITLVLSRRFPGFSPIPGLIAATAAALCVLYWGVFFTDDSSLAAIPRNLVCGPIQTVRLFMLDSDDCFLHIYDRLSPAVRSWYMFFAPLLYLMAPILSAGMVLSLFRNLSAYERLLLHPFQQAFVFSELNGKSILLAESIREKFPAALICFTRSLSGEEEGMLELRSRAACLKALLFKKDITSVHWSMGSKNRPLTFLAMTEEPALCTQESLFLRKAYGGRASASLYIFSSHTDSELLFSVNGASGLRVRRIDPIRSLVNSTLYRQGEGLFSMALPGENGKKQISALILGLGRQGSQMVKGLSWLGQMDGYDLSIHVFDWDPEAERVFTASCPELMSSDYNGTDVDGEARYKITIHSGVSVDSPEFQHQLRDIGPVTYVLTALGSDRSNVEAAVQMRRLCLQNGSRPLIHCILFSGEETELLNQATDYRGHSYDLQFIGNLRDFYSYDTIFNNELEDLALRRHLKWGDEASFWAYEFNYQSSVASAIHAKMRQLCGIPGAGKPENQVTKEEKLALECLEHRRWNAYMRSEGYCYSGSPSKESRNDLAKLHNDLIPFRSLTKEEQEKDFVGSI